MQIELASANNSNKTHIFNLGVFYGNYDNRNIVDAADLFSEYEPDENIELRCPEKEFLQEYEEMNNIQP